MTLTYIDGFRQIIQDRPIAYHPLLAKVLGGVTAGLFLSQLMYWSDKGQQQGNWIWKTRAEWEEETGLTRYEQEGARRKLLKAGVIEEDRRGVPGKMHFRVIWSTLQEVISYHIVENPHCGKPPIYNGEKPHCNSETTPEITSPTYIGVAPDYFQILQSIPGFGATLMQCEVWREHKGFSVYHAETVALALAGKWNPKKWTHVYRTWQHWMKMPPLQGRDNDRISKPRRTAAAALPTEDDFAHYGG